MYATNNSLLHHKTLRAILKNCRAKLIRFRYPAALASGSLGIAASIVVGLFHELLKVTKILPHTVV